MLSLDYYLSASYANSFIYRITRFYLTEWFEAIQIASAIYIYFLQLMTTYVLFPESSSVSFLCSISSIPLWIYLESHTKWPQPHISIGDNKKTICWNIIHNHYLHVINMKSLFIHEHRYAYMYITCLMHYLKIFK